jgi:hypothetical protein
MSDETYVTNDAWLRTAGRPGSIDEVADQFERPAGEAAFWSEQPVQWPRSSRGWRPPEHVHQRAPERRVG